MHWGTAWNVLRCRTPLTTHHAVDGVVVAAAVHVQRLAPVPQVHRRLAVVRPLIGAGRNHSAAVWIWICPAAAAVGAVSGSSAPGGGPACWQAPPVQGAPAAARYDAPAIWVHRLQCATADLTVYGCKLAQHEADRPIGLTRVLMQSIAGHELWMVYHLSDGMLSTC